MGPMYGSQQQKHVVLSIRSESLLARETNRESETHTNINCGIFGVFEVLMAFQIVKDAMIVEGMGQFENGFAANIQLLR